MGRRRQVRMLAAALVAALAGVAVTPPGARAHDGPAVDVRPVTFDVVDGPNDDQHVRIDASLYVPSTATDATPAPVVVLAHGFGGSKDDLDALARQTAHRGFVALAYSARGFGRSTGTIGLASVDYDVKDVVQMIDALADMPEVLLDGPGDPRVGISGRSYGGGVALMAATADPRIDAIAPRITWASLAYALGPNNLLADDSGLELAGDEGPAGIYKLQWATVFFGVGASQPATDATGIVGGPDCLGFVREVCRAYLASAAAGELTDESVALLERSSPLGRLDGVDVPTFLVQGEDDTLFNLAESVRTTQALRSNGAPVKLLWHSGGHSGSLAPGEAEERLEPDDVVNARILNWWERWLGDDPAVDTGPGFEYALEDSEGRVRYGAAPAYPALGDSVRFLSGDGRIVDDPTDADRGTSRFANPLAGLPAAYSETSGLQEHLDLPAFDLPGQHLRWETPAFPDDTALVGVPRLGGLELSSSTGETWFFAKLYDVAPDGRGELIRRQVSAVRSDDLSRPLDVALPGLAHVVEAGHRLRLVLASTDVAYANRRTPDTYTVTIDPSAPPRLLLPMAPASGTGSPR
ncbi:MAG: alpha/beta fold hydrolase [Actinobacteria bacterium]|nr:alpha/beta fold hydrolase [Actinomycetota bacterium]